MSTHRFFARAGGDANAVAQVTSLLATRWDPTGELMAPDSSRDASAHAVTVLGILATGPDIARVMGYLRTAEEKAWGGPRTSGSERHALAQEAHAILRAAAERELTAARMDEGDKAT